MDKEPGEDKAIQYHEGDEEHEGKQRTKRWMPAFSSLCVVVLPDAAPNEISGGEGRVVGNARPDPKIWRSPLHIGIDLKHFVNQFPDLPFRFPLVSWSLKLHQV